MAKRYCERKVAPKKAFDKRSFRWVTRDRVRVLVGCPRGSWRAGRCRVGTRAYAVLVASKRGPCCPKARPGERCVIKR